MNSLALLLLCSRTFQRYAVDGRSVRSVWQDSLEYFSANGSSIHELPTFDFRVPNFAMGGTAEPTALGLAVMQAMKREGPMAVTTVASRGEEILSTRNSDAQFYRALKIRGRITSGRE